MSHPDSSHDHENERADDDLLLDEIDARRREDERDALEESLRIAAYAESRGFGDRIAWRGHDLTVTGAPMEYDQRRIGEQYAANIAYSNSIKERK